MSEQFPGAVPEIRVSDVARAAIYYENREFTARDLDGNRFRVFYDFAWELPDRGGRKDDAAERDARARF
jgi:hypothetical protein